MLNNKYFLKIIVFLTFLLFISGCATISPYYVSTPLGPAERFNFDISTGNDTGRLIINCKPPYEQVFIYYYGIKIDDREPIKVPKFSIVNIEIDAGTHKIELYSIASGLNFIYGEIFGYKTEKTIKLEPKKTVVYEYIGPAMVLSEGKFRLKEEHEWSE